MALTTEDRAAAISLRQLRLFVAIGDLKSVRRASEECGLSQPAVTQALAKLEEQVGVTLVNRRADGSYLNELGTIFHARVRRFLDQTERALIDAGSVASPRAAEAIANRLTRSQLRMLVGVSEAGSFERASEALGISISSLHRAARDLESNMRVSLFYRTAVGMIVGPVGVTFGRRIKLALQEVEWAIEEVEGALGRSSRQTVIGAMPFGGSLLLSSVLDEFLAAHPRADIHIINDSAPKLMKSLGNGDVDLVIGLLPERIDDDITAVPLAPTPYSIVARRGHPLLARSKVRHDDLVACDWVIGTEGSGRRACFDRLFVDGATPPARISTCAQTVLQHLLKSSDRLALMTEYEIEHGDDDLRPVPFDPIAPVPSIGIMMRTNWLPTRLHGDFVDIVRRRVRAPRPQLRQVV